jgi:hypothetical protein
VQAEVRGRRAARQVDRPGGRAEDGGAAGLDDDGGRLTRSHGGTGQADGGRAQQRAHRTVAGRLARRGAVVRSQRNLGYRHRLAGQQRLVDGEILGREDEAVGGCHVAGGEPDQVAGYE